MPITEVFENAIIPGTTTSLVLPAAADDDVIHVTGPAAPNLQGGIFRVVAVNPLTGEAEYMMVRSGHNGANWTVDRGIENSEPQDFPVGTIIKHVWTAGSLAAIGGGEADALNVKSAPYFAKGDGKVDDTVALTNAIIDAQVQNCRIFLPPGNYIISEPLPQLTPQADVGKIGAGCLGIIGSGRRVTTITCNNDFGVGKIAIDCSGYNIGTNLGHVLRGFTLTTWGPYASPGNQGSMWKMQGIRVANIDLCEEIEVTRTWAAYNVSGDHSTFIDCWGENNGYALYHTAPDPQNLGNNTFIACKFDGCATAGVAVAAGSASQGDLYLQTHFGFAPYAFYKEGVGTPPYNGQPLGEIFMDACTFAMCFCEQTGNGIFYDESHQAVLSNTTIIGCQGFGFGSVTGGNRDVRNGNSWANPAWAADWNIDVGVISQMRIYGGAGTFANPANKGVFRARGIFQDIYYDEALVLVDSINRMNGNLGNAAGSAQSVVIAMADEPGQMSAFRLKYNATECRVVPSTGTIAKNDVAYVASVNGVVGASRNAGGAAQDSPVIGVAMTQSSTAYGSGGIIIADHGHAVVNLAAGLNLGASGAVWLKPTPEANDGTATIAKNQADYSIGYWEQGQSGNTAVVHLNLVGGGALLTPAPIIQFGTGADGAITLDGTVRPAWATYQAPNYILTRDVNFTDLTINSGISIITHGYRIFATGTITQHGNISNGGGPGDDGTNGPGSSYAGSFGGGGIGGWKVYAPPAAPTLALAGAAGNLGDGQYRYSISFVSPHGETEAGAEAMITTVAGNEQVTLSNIAVGPANGNQNNVTARKIYRSPVNGTSASKKLVATINDNTTTTYTDNLADSGLGASIPARNTTGDSAAVTNSLGAVGGAGSGTDAGHSGAITPPSSTNGGSSPSAYQMMKPPVTYNGGSGGAGSSTGTGGGGAGVVFVAANAIVNGAGILSDGGAGGPGAGGGGGGLVFLAYSSFSTVAGGYVETLGGAGGTGGGAAGQPGIVIRQQVQSLASIIAGTSVSKKPLGDVYPEDFGAKGDGIIIYYGTMAAGSNLLNVADQSQAGTRFPGFQANDVNKRIIVSSVGPGNDNLVTTIQAVNSSTQVQLAASATVASPDINGIGVCVYGTDDTAAIQAASDAAASSNTGTVIFDSKVYLICGALAQGGVRKSNSQITLPYGGYIGGVGRLFWRGARGSASSPQMPFPTPQGTILISTLNGQSYSSTYGVPSVVGGATQEQSSAFSGWAFECEDLTLLAPRNPTISGFNLERMSAQNRRRVSVGTLEWGYPATNFIATANVLPSHPQACAMIDPMTSNQQGGLGVNDRITTWGFFAGHTPTEHTFATTMRFFVTKIPIAIRNAFVHMARYQMVSSETNPYFISGWNPAAADAASAIIAVPSMIGGGGGVFVDQADFEDFTDSSTGAYSWALIVNHVNDPNNWLRGRLNFSRWTWQTSAFSNRTGIIKSGGQQFWTRPSNTIPDSAILSRANYDQSANGQIGTISTVGTWTPINTGFSCSFVTGQSGMVEVEWEALIQVALNGAASYNLFIGLVDGSNNYITGSGEIYTSSSVDTAARRVRYKRQVYTLFANQPVVVRPAILLSVAATTATIYYGGTGLGGNSAAPYGGAQMTVRALGDDSFFD